MHIKLVCVLAFAVAASGLSQETSNYDVSPPALNGRPLRTVRTYSRENADNRSNQMPSHNSLLMTPDVLDRQLTQHYIRQYSSRGGITWINSIIANGSLYLPFVRNEIANRGIPPELLFLPFIESGYLGTARSRSGAMGIWQFMMNSIAPFNIKVNELIDERRDFRKSTVAALQKLTDNHRAMGDWYLALAAYNAGLGAVNRAIKNADSRNYWVLCDKKELKQETIHYVPKFLAVSYILSHPRQFGIQYWPETIEWTAVKPLKQVSLDIIARETGTDLKLLYRLNPELLHGITPPDRNYELKIPVSQTEAVAALLAREDTVLLRHYHYKVKYGDTLFALGRHYNVPVDMIEQYNPGITNRYLQIGEIIIIPALKEINPYTSGSGAVVPIPFNGTHLVVRGDTLWSLAIRYQVDPLVLAEENGMNLNQILSIGKVLKVPIME